MVQKKKSVFKSIFFNYVLLSVLVIFVIFSVVAYFFHVEFRKKEIERHNKVFHEYADTVKTKLENSIQMSNYVLQNHDFLLNLTKPYDDNYMEMYEFLTEGEMYIKTFFATDDIGEFIIYNPNESLYETKHIVHTEALPNYDTLKEEMEQSGDGIVWQEEADGTGAKVRVYRNIPVKNGGIMMFTVNVPKAPDEGEYIVVSVETQIVGDKDEVVLSKNLNVALSMHKILQESELRKNDFTIYTLFFAVFVFVTLVYMYMAHQIQKRTSESITDFITQLESTEYVVSDEMLRITDEDNMELKVIKKAVNNLKHEIKRHTDNRLNEVYEKRKLKLELLQSKIDPHLLYNSLSYLNLIAAKEGDIRTVEVITVLSDYYRRVLSKGKDMSTLKEEIDMLKIYLRVVELSQRCEIQFDVVFSEELENIKIPHLLLQPFVENSVKHGLSGKDFGVIRIRAEENRGIVTITIEDNGYGMKESDLKCLNQMRLGRNELKRGYGIYNIYERLTIYYGEEDSDIKFFSELEKGTKVEIRFNIEREGESL